MRKSTNDYDHFSLPQLDAVTTKAFNVRFAETIYPLLALKLQARNEAIGIGGITPQVAGLLELWFRHLAEIEYKERLREMATTEKQYIDLGLSEFERLKADMKQAQTLDEKRAILAQARELLGEVGVAVEGLELIATGDYEKEKTEATET